MKSFENYLKTADIKQKMMIFISFFIVVGFLLNYFVSPMLERQRELQNSVDRLQLDLSRNLAGKLKRQLSRKTNELLKVKDELESQKSDTNYLISSIYGIPYASFSDMRWANTLDDILRFSVQKNLKIKSLKSIDIIDTSKTIIKKKKDINIVGIGRYANILDGLQYIENFDTLLRFNKITIKLVNKNVEFEFDLSAYGVGL